MWGIRADRVFDGTRFVEHPTVLIDDDTVVDVGVTLPETVDVHELAGSTVLPGLVDCHQHLVFDGAGSLEQQVVGCDERALRDRARTAAARALRGGVTSLRDLGDRGFVTLDLRDDADLAHVVASGPPITPPGGHCWYLGGETVGPDGLRAAVAERAERGCDVVKVMVTGGALTPAHPVWASQFDLDEVRLVVDAAHARGLPVAAHCHGEAGIADAVTAGVDSIEHCTFVSPAMTCVPDERLLERVAASGIAVSATLGTSAPYDYPPPWDEIVPAVRAAFGRIHAAGGVLVVGTDAGINRVKPHDVLPHSYAVLVREAGMAPIEALAAITSVAAEVCRLPDRGRLGRGAVADVVAIDGDPVDDVEAITRIVDVWRSGRRVDGGITDPDGATTPRSGRRTP